MTSNVGSVSCAAVIHALPYESPANVWVSTKLSTSDPQKTESRGRVTLRSISFVDLLALSDPDNGGVQAPTVEVAMSLAQDKPWKARPTVYNGIQMRSRLEATFAEMTDRIGVQWEYEPRAYGATGRRQYLPDFQIWLKDGKYNFYVEVRPTPEQAYLAMDRMTVIWESEPDAGLIVTTPHGPSWVADSDDRRWLLIDLPWGWT